MKTPRAFVSSLLVFAALAVLAGDASATTLTSPAGTTVTPTIKAEAEGSITWDGTIALACGKSSFEGTIESHGSEAPAAGKLSSLTFSECGNHTVTVTKPGSIAVHATSEDSGTLKSSGAEVTWLTHSIFLGTRHCIYVTNQTALGTLTGSGTTKGNATLDINAAPIPQAATDALCGNDAELTGSYKVTTPASLIVDKEPVPPSNTPVRYIGENDQIRIPVNPANNITGAITMAALVNPEGSGEHYYLTMLNEAGSPVGYKLFENSEGFLKLTNGFGGAEDTKAVGDSGWQLVVVTKDAGEVKPRFHIYSYTSKAWVHRTAAEEVPNGGNVSGGKIRIGGLGEEEYAAAALFSRVLSDAEVEDLTTDYEEWLELEPTGMWILNQPDVTKPVLDETGGGADEIVGETFGTEVKEASSPPNDDPDGTIFRGDLHRGVSSEWDQEQLSGASAELSIKELSPPLPSENYFGRFSLSTGDTQSELSSGLHLFEGEDVYVRFLVRLSKGFPVEESPTVWGERVWNLHDDEGKASPPLTLYIRDSGAGRYALEDSERTVWWLGPEIDSETWHEFVIRVNHSEKSEVGFAEVWMDGVQQKMSNGLNRRYGPTMLDEFNYPKAGYRRDEDMVGTGYVDIAGYRIAKNLSDLP